RTSAGVDLAYDTLVIATGSYPFVPPIPGRDRAGCFVYRTLEDLEAIRESASEAKVGAVIGGGLLGLEAAKALKDLGLETHVVEFAPRLMAVQVIWPAARCCARRLKPSAFVCTPAPTPRPSAPGKPRVIASSSRTAIRS